MKTTITIILSIAWLILLSLIWSNLESVVWKVILTFGWLFVTWIAIELSIAKQMPDDYLE